MTEKQDSVYDTVGYVVGRDKKGRLVTYNLYGGLDNEAVLSTKVDADFRYLVISRNSFDGELDLWNVQSNKAAISSLQTQ